MRILSHCLLIIGILAQFAALAAPPKSEIPAEPKSLCEAAILSHEEKVQLGREQNVEKLSGQDGWLKYIPPRWRLNAIQTAFLASPTRALMSSGLGQYLTPTERKVFALQFADGHPVEYLQNIDVFGLRSGERSRLLSRVILGFSQKSQLDTQIFANALVASSLPVEEKSEITRAVIAFISRFFNSSHNGQSPLVEQLAGLDLAALGMQLPNAAENVVEEILLRSGLGSFPEQPNEAIAYIWQRVKIPSAGQAKLLLIWLRHGKLPPANIELSLNDRDRRMIWDEIKENPSIDFARFSQRLKAPKGYLDQIALLRAPTSFAEVIFGFQNGRDYALRFLQAHSRSIGKVLNNREHGVVLAAIASGLRFRDVLPYMTDIGFGSGIALELYFQFTNPSSDETWEWYSQAARSVNTWREWDLTKDDERKLTLFIDRLGSRERQIEFLIFYGKKVSSDDALAQLKTLDWPMNVKENILNALGPKYKIERLVELSGMTPPKELILRKLEQAGKESNSDDVKYAATLRPADRLAAAKLFFRGFAKANQNNKETYFLNQIDNFILTRSEDRRDVAIEILRQNTDIDLFTLATRFRLTKDQRNILKQVRFAENIETTLSKFLHQTTGAELNPIAPLEDLLPVFDAYAQKYPEILPPGLVEKLSTTVQRREVVIRTLRLYYRVNDYKLPAELPTGPEAVWSQGLGWPMASVVSAARFERFATVIDLALDIEGTVRTPPFANFPFADDAFAKPQLETMKRILNCLRDWYHLRGNTADDWSGILKALNGLGFAQVEAANLNRLAQEAAQSVVREIQSSFSGTEVSFTYDQLEKLKAEWGDLEPIFTLIARYKGESQWKGRLKELGAIFQAALSHQFLAFKTAGDEQAKLQLAMLKGPEQIAAWLQIRYRLGFYNPSGASPNGASTLAPVFEIIQRNLSTHYEGWQGSRPNVSLLEFIRGNKGRAQEVLSKIKDSLYPSLDETTFLKTLEKDLMVAIIVEPNKANLDTAIWAMMAFQSHFNLTADATNDIRDINNFLKDYKVKSSADDIVFTTMFNHPKTLITIGDLVQVGSCQNYRTGSVIGTLPGYVMDAGVQGIASFVLGAGQFANIHDFESIKQALKEGRVRSAEFLGENNVVKFVILDGDQEVEIKSRALEYAYRRHVIKLGRTAQGGAGIMLEPAYQQNHDAIEMMKAQTLDIRNELALSLGAATLGPMVFPKSRNGGGIYSDNGSGVMTGDYSIDVKDSTQQ